MTSQDMFETLVIPLFSDFVDNTDEYKSLVKMFAERIRSRNYRFHEVGVIHVTRVEGEDQKQRIWVTLNSRADNYGDYITVIYMTNGRRVAVTIYDNIRGTIMSGEIKKVIKKLEKTAKKTYDLYVTGRNETLVIILKALMKALEKERKNRDEPDEIVVVEDKRQLIKDIEFLIEKYKKFQDNEQE